MGSKMAGQCCCGRISECEEPVLFNEHVHEPLGPEGAFCGPASHHTIRDQDREIKRLAEFNVGG